ncbi:SDR family NAD(P)-dependent oxidoreductase [Paenibacillus macerans]|uniref:SDR family NAD(P)-dependent oxidoreductase n=1 Tax=Paenibacillus macerans TaxID=44252 RepID=A0A6N8EVN4_PAEMA|nr:SDR family NAD(P)-dependent oxidoreductase [Paenibacillus macerans]MBS5915058.1 SDR family NAD(P)-dependent oxidoreductase [Paenibacillus macerans]MDU5948003.1 SDR family NAD(P)-dependent oxidoreductase [Paenibacillus macerans]MEC0135603.1 SDR family NAD(P)-dependent oxidoreductase [Paenibacillus macerans]MUG22502.1 SDR family NAD(P)-dependent oxidoreductase [Paenibacillus macerans]UMV49263.1 SDR family NAD(P)-dependent oxidoreductase [Paenibacillus macerans]
MKIIVTGAGRGLGQEILKEAVGRGHEVAAGLRSLDTDLDPLKELQVTASGRLTLLELDVDEEESVLKAREAMVVRKSSYIGRGLPLCAETEGAGASFFLVGIAFLGI